MIEKHITSCGDTGQSFLMIPLGTKNFDVAVRRAEVYVNDLLSASTFTRRNMKSAPNYKRTLQTIEKRLWSTIKEKK